MAHYVRYACYVVRFVPVGIPTCVVTLITFVTLRWGVGGQIPAPRVGEPGADGRLDVHGVGGVSPDGLAVRAVERHWHDLVALELLGQSAGVDRLAAQVGPWRLVERGQLVQDLDGGQLLLVAEDASQVAEQAHTERWGSGPGLEHEVFAGSAGGVGPVPAGGVGDREQRLPHLGRAV